MAHDITSEDGLILVGEPAWHGLGVTIPRDAGLTAREGFERAVPWTPELVPAWWNVRTETKRVLDDGTAVIDDGALILPDARVVVRKNRDGTTSHLATVSADYALVNHEEVLTMAELVEDQGATLESVGTMQAGRKLFLLMKVGQYGVGLNKEDQTSTYLALLNSFDGSTAFRGFGTEVRIVCRNTYSAALSRADSDAVGFRIHHKGDLAARIKAAQTALAQGKLQLAQLQTEAERLAETPVGVKRAGEYFARVASILFPAIATTRPTDEKEAEAWQRQRDRARETVTDWVREFEHERQALVSGTMYAALEAVTHWADHDRTRVRERAADQLLGRGAAIKYQARAAALELAGAPGPSFDSHVTL